MLYPHLKRVIQDAALIPQGSTVVIGVSGGIDSMVLLDLLARLAPRFDLHIVVAHVNHGLRGKQSDLDEALVRAIEAQHGFPCVVAHLHPGKKGNLQDEARKVRKRFLATTAARFESKIVCLAHQEDDQAETILLHLIRGAGLSGLTGMRPSVREGEIAWVRPLLDVRRAQIEQYATVRKIKFREDASNSKTVYRRNHVRKKVIPSLALLNPRIATTLAQMGTRLAEDDDALRALASAAAGEVVHQPSPDRVELDLKRYRACLPAVRRRLLREAFLRLTGTVHDLAADHLIRMDQIAFSEQGRAQYRLPKGSRCIRRGSTLAMERTKAHEG